jgi:hypothetical protein
MQVTKRSHSMTFPVGGKIVDMNVAVQLHASNLAATELVLRAPSGLAIPLIQV